ncbi:MAG: hypothetical protein ACQCN4_02680 [Candidatus Bathyarchaeia archaeon]|jgi:hypothetical protein
MPNCLVVDSSVLIFFDKKGKLDFLRQKKKENYKAVIPQAIVQEVIGEPKGFAEKILENISRVGRQNIVFR